MNTSNLLRVSRCMFTIRRDLQRHAASALLAAFFGLGFPISVYAQHAGSRTGTLYERIGGKSVVSSLVSDLIDQSTRDPRTKRPFDKVDLKRLKQKVEEQICALTGGPCQYTGDDMKKSHAGLKITEAEFYGFVEELVEILDKHNIGLREKNQLLAILAPMKRDVVTE